MRLRARHIRHIEVFTDNVLGFVLNFTISLLVFNLVLGQDITFSQNLYASCAFFVVAYIRKYTLRR